MDITALVSSHGGIAQQVLDAGVHPLRLRAAITDGVVRRVRRYWIATTSAPPARVAAAARRPPVVTHWTRPLVAVSRYDLVESIADTRQHIADCLPREQAIVLWESAARIHALRIEELNRVCGCSPAAREVCALLSGQSGSGIETIFIVRMRP